MKTTYTTLILLLLAFSTRGQDDYLGTSLWYEPDTLNSTILDGTNWTLFELGCGAGQGSDAYEGPIQLPFDFCFYDNSYDEVFLSTKGVLTFIEPMCDWIPDEFPGQNGFNMIAGYWANFDFEAGGGLCYYEIFEHEAIFTFDHVGLWPGFSYYKNTFQMIISDGMSELLPGGNNVGFFYQDMQWAGGVVTPKFPSQYNSIVGVDESTGNNHIQFGRFNHFAEGYNGSYEQSAYDWLDYKNFIFSTCGTENQSPISSFNNSQINGESSSLATDTIQLCPYDTLLLSVDYFGPEGGQTISLEIDSSSAGNFTLLNQNDGEVATWNGYFVMDDENNGINVLTITATDNGVPIGVTTQNIIVEVMDAESLEIEIIGNTTICAGDPAELTAMPDTLDYYIWSNGCEGTSPNCDVYNEGWVSVIGYYGQCSGEGSVFIEVNAPILYYPTIVPPPPYCEEDTICLSISGDSVLWSCSNFGNFDCNIYSDSPNQNMIYCSTGAYNAEYIDYNGCYTAVNYVIPSAFIGDSEEEMEPICGTLEPFEFEDGYVVAGEGYLTIYFQDIDGNYANGSWLNVTINGVTSQVAMTSSTFSLINNEFAIEIGDEICIEYVPSPEDDGNNTITIYNCGNSNNALCGSLIGYSNSPIEYVLCDTTYTGQTLQWCGTAACYEELLYGEWSQESTSSDGSFSTTDEYNTVFTPSENGVYDLTFTASEYECIYEYQLIYADATSFDYLDELVICDTTIAITLYGESPLGGYFSGTGVTGNIFDPAVAGSGTHQICYTYPQLYCDSTVCIEMLVDDCNSINDLHHSPFNLYPNPTSGLLTIDSPFDSGEIYVFDAVGKMVLTKTLSRKTVIKANAWSEGIYFLHVHTSDGVFREKIEIVR